METPKSQNPIQALETQLNSLRDFILYYREDKSYEEGRVVSVKSLASKLASFSNLLVTEVKNLDSVLEIKRVVIEATLDETEEKLKKILQNPEITDQHEHANGSLNMLQTLRETIQIILASRASLQNANISTLRPRN